MKNEHWTESQLGDAPFYRRRTDKFTPANPLAIVGSLIVMLFAVFGALSLADRIASRWK